MDIFQRKSSREIKIPVKQINLLFLIKIFFYSILYTMEEKNMKEKNVLELQEREFQKLLDSIKQDLIEELKEIFSFVEKDLEDLETLLNEFLED
jgi:hypothetical protein